MQTLEIMGFIEREFLRTRNDYEALKKRRDENRSERTRIETRLELLGELLRFEGQEVRFPWDEAVSK
jgi:hypothetical protein